MENKEEVAYFKDINSNVVLKFAGKWDIDSMRSHREYVEVTEKDYKDYNKLK